MGALGIFHTAISVLALIIAFAAFFKSGKIIPKDSMGKLYSVLTVVACITAFGLSKHGGINPGHIIGILILILLVVVYATHSKQGRFMGYLQLGCMTGTVFLSLIPAINETLTRFPVSAPLATGPDSPAIKSCIQILFLVFLAFVIWQIRRYKKTEQLD